MTSSFVGSLDKPKAVKRLIKTLNKAKKGDGYAHLRWQTARRYDIFVWREHDSTLVMDPINHAFLAGVTDHDRIVAYLRHRC